MARYFMPISLSYRMLLIVAWYLALTFAGTVLFNEDALAETSPLHLSQHDSRLFAQGHIYFFEDKNSDKTFQEVRYFVDSQWRLSEESSPSFGLNKGQYWFKITVQNSEPTKVEYVALVNYTALDYIDFFAESVSNGKTHVSQFKTGDYRPFSARPIEHLSFAFPITLEAKQETTLYFRVKSGGNIVFPISFWGKSHFFQNQKNLFVLFGFVAGIMLITGVYNFFVYLRAKEKVFLAFSLFVLSIVLLFAIQSGMAYLYLWPDLVLWNEVCILAVIGFTLSSHLFFSTKYLPVNAFVYRMSKYVMLFILALPLFYPVLPYQTLLLISLLVAVLILIGYFGVAIHAAILGNKNARIYSFAWTPFIVGAIVSSSIRFDIAPFSFLTENATFFGALTTIIVLSMAIADRINSEKTQRIRAQLRAIESLEKYETLFNESVEGIFVFSPDGRVINANTAFFRMLMYEDMDDLDKRIGASVDRLYFDQKLYRDLLAELENSVKVVDREVEFVRKGGAVFWVSVSMRMSTNIATGENLIEGAIIDISTRKEGERQLAYLASHDPLTNLYNRRQFEKYLEQGLLADKEILYSAALYMDLDQFKIVNDTCGHTAGDHLLRNLSQMLATILAERGVIARLGGDEFGVLISRSDGVDPRQVAEQLCRFVEEYRFLWEGRVFNLGVSIGFVELSRSFTSVEEVMRLADTACYAAKDAGRNRIHEYSANSVELKQRRTEMELVSAINSSLVKNNLCLMRQSIALSHEPTKKVAYEILVRMRDQEGGLISPAQFIPAAERYNIMHMIDRWVSKSTFEWLSANPSELDDVDHYAINLSGQALGDEKFKAYIMQLFAQYQVPYHKVCFEVTETTAIQNLHDTITFIQFLRDKGCIFSLDDFGAGFSSYGYLKNIPVDNLKIDGQFIRNIDKDEIDYALVQSICAVAKIMGKKTIAEFVENQVIADKLAEIGVDYVQGFHIDRPSLIEINHSAVNELVE